MGASRAVVSSRTGTAPWDIALAKRDQEDRAGDPHRPLLPFQPGHARAAYQAELVPQLDDVASAHPGPILGGISKVTVLPLTRLHATRNDTRPAIIPPRVPSL